MSATATRINRHVNTAPERFLDALTATIAVVGWCVLCLVVVFADPLRAEFGVLPALVFATGAVIWWMIMRRAGIGRTWSVAPFYGMIAAAVTVSVALLATALALLV